MRDTCVVRVCQEISRLRVRLLQFSQFQVSCLRLEQFAVIAHHIGGGIELFGKLVDPRLIIRDGIVCLCDIHAQNVVAPFVVLFLYFRKFLPHLFDRPVSPIGKRFGRRFRNIYIPRCIPCGTRIDRRLIYPRILKRSDRTDCVNSHCNSPFDRKTASIFSSSVPVMPAASATPTS